MSDIRIDMFEVQLGAAILLQFADESGPVTVLADAGVKASGYAPDHVYNKVLPILDGNGERRIDLIVGTHYDEDHLNGLVPIIDDVTISIGEAWMPPVVNDTQAFAFDQTLSGGDLLPQQFHGEAGTQILIDYLATKRADCQLIEALESTANSNDINFFAAHAAAELRFDGDLLDLSYFRAQLGQDHDHDHPEHDPASDGDPVIGHALAAEIDPVSIVDEEAANRMLARYPFYLRPGSARDVHSRLNDVRADAPSVGAAQSRSLANIRKSAAKDAINAKALHDVMQALAARNIAVRSEIIDDGEPRRYRWDPGARRFLAAKPDAAGLSFTLLGPSRSLVKKHRDRLPVLEAAKVALAFRGEILSITPSNQLSYIGRFAHAEQGVLIAGDAGCVDFSNGPNSYYPKLLAALEPLHIVQVAHHGGNNAHFYRVLKAARFPEQTTPSLLLLSHAFHDRTRPSPAFEDFLLTTLDEGDDVKLLFTSEPTRSKVAAYLAAIHPLAGVAAKADVGDVSIVFDQGAWAVKTHAIAP
jgi:hypothetical protein